MKHVLAILCTAALASTAAMAADEDREPGSKEIFKTLDADGDGKVSKEEAAGNESFTRNFSMLDGNSDGFVTRKELRRNTMPRPKPSN